VESLLAKNGVQLIRGSGEITGPNTVMVNGEQTRASSIIVATGSRPRELPGFEFDGERVLSSDHALMLTRLPKSLLILGGGPIGVEFAYIMNAFGVKVHVVELMDRLLPLEDAQVVEVLTRAFERSGIEVSTGAQAKALQKVKGGVKLTIGSAAGSERSLEAEKLLVVVGRTPNTDGIGLETVGITVDRGFVPVGDYYQTPVPGIWAIGDVVASPMLAHVASKEGEIAVHRIAGRQTVRRLDPLLIPSAVYTEPQLASFGLTEEQARERGVRYATASFPYRGAGKSVAVGHPEGLAKLLYDPRTHEILGAHVAGSDATELIHEILLARKAELVPAEIAEMVHAHPTLAEVVMELMRAAEGWAIHV
jgi:dihydrolipoamide dehydrogenase